MSEYQLKPEITFEDLRVHYGTGRAFTVISNGYEKKTHYRSGMMTNLGDIKKSEWISMMKALIAREKEEYLQAYLKEWFCDDPVYHDKNDLELHTLELHAMRIFDDELWVDFIPFNRKYRPEVLDKTKLVQVINTCCQRHGWVTMKSAMNAHSGINYCPHCGRYTEFKIVTGGETNAEGREL